MLGKNLLELERLANRTVNLNTVMNSFIVHKTKRDGDFQVLSIYLTLGYKPLYYPNNALTRIKCMVIKNIKIIENAPTCFGSRRNHPQGANFST